MCRLCADSVRRKTEKSLKRRYCKKALSCPEYNYNYLKFFISNFKFRTISGFLQLGLYSCRKRRKDFNQLCLGPTLVCNETRAEIRSTGLAGRQLPGAPARRGHHLRLT